MREQLQEMERASQPPKAEPNKFETRGYELVKLMRDGTWYQVGKYRDNEVALAQANAACTALSRSWVNETYAVRVLVSCELPKVPPQGEPMVLDADETPEAEEVTGDSTPNEEMNAQPGQ